MVLNHTTCAVLAVGLSFLVMSGSLVTLHFGIDDQSCYTRNNLKSDFKIKNVNVDEFNVCQALITTAGLEYREADVCSRALNNAESYCAKTTFTGNFWQYVMTIQCSSEINVISGICSNQTFFGDHPASPFHCQGHINDKYCSSKNKTFRLYQGKPTPLERQLTNLRNH